MKGIFSFLLLLSVFAGFAQVKFEQNNVKNKNAHVVYTGTVNSFSIILPKEVSVKNITPSVGNLRTMDDHTFVLYVQEFTDAAVELKYTQIKNGVESEEVYPVKFTVKQLPDYFHIRVGEYAESGKASLGKIQKNYVIALNDAGVNIDLKNIFITFDITKIPAGGDATALKGLASNKKEDLTAFKRMILSLKKGDRLLFENIRAAMENGISRTMDNLMLEIQ
jgi:hypothetical protein